MADLQIAPHLEDFPFRLTQQPGCGGHIGGANEDFQVEEIPAYPACGAGEHCYLWIEKKGISTPVAVKRIAAALGVSTQAVGYAGLKDTRAVTRQRISVPLANPATALALGLDNPRVLEARLHRNKLKTGHLKGNRFTIRIVDAEKGAAALGVHRGELLTEIRIPNIFGPQRFGKQGRNVIKGLEILSRTSRIRDRRRKRFFLSAFQSEMFNVYLRTRWEAGLLDEILCGDILRRGRNFFPVTDPTVEALRVRNGEVSPTGPLFGPRTPRPPPESAPRRLEDTVLARYRLDDEIMAGFGRLARGGRRDLFVRPTDLVITPRKKDGTAFDLHFGLPAGCYATVVVREILQVPFGRLRPLAAAPA
jgi:tRNA pseudouridine13 synthase